MAVAVLPELQNLILNPSFELTTAGWTRGTAQVVLPTAAVPVAERAFAGTYSAKLPVAAVAPSNQSIFRPSANISYPFVVGEVWLFSVSLERDVASLVIDLQILFLDGGGNTIAWITVPVPAGLGPIRTHAFLAVPAGVATVQPRVLFTGNNTAGTVWLDGIMFSRTDRWPGYIDGAQGADYEWLGAPHNSVSRRKPKTLQTAIGRRGIIRIANRMLKTDRKGTPLEDISKEIRGATVDLDTDRVVSPFTIKGELKRAGILSPYTDYILPSLILEHSDGTVIDEPLGLYSIAPPPRSSDYVSTRESFAGRDLTWRLSTSTFGGPYSAAQNANVISTIASIIESEGIETGSYSLTPSSKYFVTGFTWGWDQVYTKLAIINQLLDAIGYYKLHSNRYGILQSFPYLDLNKVNPAKRYFAGPGGEISGTIDEEPDYENIVNMVRVINDRTGVSPIVAVIQNNNLQSPVSIPNIAQTIFREIRDNKIPDLDTAIAIAREALQRGATYYNRVTLETVADPTRNPYDVYEMDVAQRDGANLLTGRWRCSGWSLGFTPKTASMAQRIGKVEVYE